MDAPGVLAVSVEGVSRGYGHGASEVAALDDVSLGAREGAFLAIMGPSGSGKSTLLNLIGALALAVLVSLLAGAVPSRRAVRLQPLDALRYE